MTSTAPSTCVLERYCTTDRCSSEVPGGVSTTRSSTSPQSTSRRNCLISPEREGGRKEGEERRKGRRVGGRGTEGGREGGREGRMEGWREGGSEGGKECEREAEGGRHMHSTTLNV